jgi:hypothetical protein
MKTQNNKLVALIEMHASANENGQDELCNALYHAINELAKTIGYEGENACDELSANGELEIDGVCYQFDGQTILTVNTIKTTDKNKMKTPTDKIKNLLSDLESFGWAGGKRADVMQRIVEIASMEFIDEMAEMGNGKAESVSILTNSVQDV